MVQEDDINGTKYNVGVFLPMIIGQGISYMLYVGEGNRLTYISVVILVYSSPWPTPTYILY